MPRAFMYSGVGQKENLIFWPVSLTQYDDQTFVPVVKWLVSGIALVLQAEADMDLTLTAQTQGRDLGFEKYPLVH